MITGTYNSALILGWVILGECEHHGVKSIYTGRERLLKLYNRITNRKVSMSTLDRYIRILKDFRLLYRWPRKQIYTPWGRIYRTSWSEITEKGIKALDFTGRAATAIMEVIKKKLKPPKEKAPSKGIKGARPASSAKLKTVIDTVMKTIDEG